MNKYGKRIVFDSPLEYEFYRVYKMLPFDMVDLLCETGYKHPVAFAIVQSVMNNLWSFLSDREKQRRIQEQEELRKQLELECPWPVPVPVAST